MLRSVFEASQNADGSAAEELSKYLDSIQGKIDNLVNKAQEFAFTSISSDEVKMIVDFLSTVFEQLTKIVDVLGFMPSFISTVVGALSLRNNVGRSKTYLLIA